MQPTTLRFGGRDGRAAAAAFKSRAPRGSGLSVAATKRLQRDRRDTRANASTGKGGTNPKKVVLAYSGGLDTSIILKWLQNEYGCEVVTFTADLGQGEEVEPARKKAEAMGVKEIYIDDVREEFVKDYVFPMFRSNAVYEGIYLLGTSIARPLIAKRQIEIALETGADAVCHGATGKGNDQVSLYNFEEVGQTPLIDPPKKRKRKSVKKQVN